MSLYGSLEASGPSISPATGETLHGKEKSARVVELLRGFFTVFVGLAVYQAYTTFPGSLSDSRFFAVFTAGEDLAAESTSQSVVDSPDIVLESNRTYNTTTNTSLRAAHFESVECGFGVMRLACRVTIKTTKSYRESHTMFVEYAPIYHTEALKAARSENFRPLVNNRTATIEIYRVRALTKYKINLYVMEKDGLKHKDTANFTTVGTGIWQFDDGPLVEVEGIPTAPLLNYAMHLEGGFRGVIASDAEGYVVWYLNSSASNPSAHLEAVEKSDDHHVWCVNDQGDMTVRIVNAMGTVVAARSHIAGLQGHECRFTNADDKMRVVLLTMTDEALLGHLNGVSMKFKLGSGKMMKYIMRGFYNEMIQVYEPNSDGNTTLVENVTMNDYFSFYDLYKFFTSTTNSSNSSHSFYDLYIEYSTTTHNVSDLRYIHPSSVSVAEDGDLYIISFRDCHMILGIDRHTLVKKFLLSSVVPSIGTHKFQNDHHKFYAPHDVSYHDNNTVCLMDDGVKRPQGGCTDDDNIGCFSRAVCYYINDDDYTVDLIWEFEFPHEMTGAPLNSSQMSKDLFNKNGGSVRKVTQTDWVVSFTAVNFAPYNHSSWAFGLRQDSDHEMKITSIQKVPRCLEWATNDGASGSYRATPIRSIAGELTVESSLIS